MPVSSISEEHSFSSLTGSSINMQQLRPLLESQLNVQLQDGLLLESSLGDLVRHVQYLRFVTVQDASRGRTSSVATPPELVYFHPVPTSASESSRATRKVLFLIHPIGGSAQWYSDIAGTPSARRFAHMSVESDG